MQCVAVPGQGAVGPAGDNKVTRNRLQTLHRRIQVVGFAPAQGLVPVAEYQVELRADHRLQALAEELHHARVGKAQHRLHARSLGQLPGTDGGGAPGIRGDQVAFNIQVLGVRQCRGVQLLNRQGFADTEEGVHAALGIRGNQYQAFAGGARWPLGHAVSHAGLFEVLHVDGAVGVVGDLAAHESGSTELGGRDHGVACTAAAGVARFHQVALQLRQQFGLAGLVDQRHQALVDPHGIEFGVLHLDFGVDQGCTHAVDRVFLHAPVAPSGSGRYYPDPPVK